MDKLSDFAEIYKKATYEYNFGEQFTDIANYINMTRLSQPAKARAWHFWHNSLDEGQRNMFIEQFNNGGIGALSDLIGRLDYWADIVPGDLTMKFNNALSSMEGIPGDEKMLLQKVIRDWVYNLDPQKLNEINDGDEYNLTPIILNIRERVFNR